jgi:hypothetical protein
LSVLISDHVQENDRKMNGTVIFQFDRDHFLNTFRFYILPINNYKFIIYLIEKSMLTDEVFQSSEKDKASPVVAEGNIEIVIDEIVDCISESISQLFW